MSFIAYALGFLAACGNAGANIFQRAANRTEGNQETEFSLRLIKNLLTQPLWFAGMACMAGSFFLQAAGLGFGTLAGVEPLLVLELPLTMVASWLWLGEGIGPRAWAAIISMSASTIALIACLGPTGGRTRGIVWWEWLLAVGVTMSVVTACYLLGRSWSDQARRSAVLGVGTGACFGLAASLVKGMTTQFAAGGIVGVLASWQLYGAIAAGAFAVWMQQNALSAARLVVAQPGITLGDPYVSILWGVTVFGEGTRGGVWLGLAAVSALAMTGSAIALSRTRSAGEAGSPDPAAAGAEPARTARSPDPEDGG